MQRVVLAVLEGVAGRLGRPRLCLVGVEDQEDPLEKLQTEAHLASGNTVAHEVDGDLVVLDVHVGRDEAGVADDVLVDGGFQLVIGEDHTLQSVVVVDPREVEPLVEIAQQVLPLSQALAEDLHLAVKICEV
jgi:hypothetical protein